VRDKFVFFSCPLVKSSLEHFTPCSFSEATNCASEIPISFDSAVGRQEMHMYQCEETCHESKKKDSLGRNTKVTKCSYEMVWKSKPIEGTQFRKSLAEVDHRCPGIQALGGNPAFPLNMPTGGESTRYAQNVKAGVSSDKSYALNPDLVQSMSANKKVDLSTFASSFSGPARRADTVGASWIPPTTLSAATLMVSRDNDLVTCDPSNLWLGCVRIQYFMSNSTSPSVITHVASGGSTEPEGMPASWGCRSSGWQELLPDKMSKPEMVAALKVQNKTKVWVLRLVGVVLCWLAVYCCLSPISAAADVFGDCFNILPCGGYLEDFLKASSTRSCASSRATWAARALCL